MENQRAKFAEIGKKLGINEGEFEKWYSVSSRSFRSLGGAGILVKKYDNNILKMLKTIFPDYNWLPWKFSRASKGTLKDKTVVLQAVKSLEKKLLIKVPMDWQRISLSNISEFEEIKVFDHNGGLKEVLKSIYPETFGPTKVPE